MGRTLRGFEEEFPYRGSRGDVSDAAIMDKEEAYGEDDLFDDVDSDVFGGISSHVVDSMFGGGPSRPQASAGWLFSSGD